MFLFKEIKYSAVFVAFLGFALSAIIINRAADINFIESITYYSQNKQRTAEAATGSLFPHINTWGMFLSQAGTTEETTFASTRFDIVGGRMGANGRNIIYSANPNAMFCSYVNVPTYDVDNSVINQWLVDNGHDPEDLVLHYNQDTYVPIIAETIKGWRAECSPDSCDPPATANSRTESRVFHRAGSGGTTWEMRDYNNPADIAATSFISDYFDDYASAQTSKCIFLDSVPIFDTTIAVWELAKTDAYANLPYDYNHPRVREQFDWGNDMIAYIASTYGPNLIGIPNATASSVNNMSAFKSLFEDLYDWDFIEFWSSYIDSDTKIASIRTTSYEQDYNDDIKIIVEQTRAGEKRLLRGNEYYNRETNRGKIFLLANYYLVHNDNTYFNYKVVDAPANYDSPTKSWFGGMEYNIGQAALNPVNQLDFASSPNTKEHYEWATGADPADPSKTYHILARHFDNALVLVKYKPKDSTIAASSVTTHQLDKSYRPLNADGSLGAAINEISLANNEAAILIPVDNSPPTSIGSLQATASGVSQIDISWIAPSDDVGVSSYELRFSTSIITSDNFSATSLFGGLNNPQAPGSTESVSVTGLSKNQIYYFAVKSTDNTGNISTISNIASASTVCEPNWSCLAWSTCLNGSQSRSCSDANSCGDNSSKPLTVRNCTVVGDEGCTSIWSCTNWSTCQNSVQSRSCSDSNSCANNTSPPTSQVCGDPAEANSFLAKVNSGNAVYYISNAGIKYVFPDLKTYSTWYDNFDNISNLTPTQLDQYPDGGTVTYRPGTKLITHSNTARIYAVSPGGMLHWIPDEATARRLYGVNWAALVQDVIPGFFSASYKLASALSDKLPDGTIVADASEWYYIQDGQKRRFSSQASFLANRLRISDLINININEYPLGEAISGEEELVSRF